MSNRVLEGFLRRQLEEGRQLADASGLLSLRSIGLPIPRRYIASLHCRGLVRDSDGTVREARHFCVGIQFPHDYLRRVDPFEVLSWLGPPNVFHPNIRVINSGARGFIGSICVGHLVPGTGIVDLLYRVFEIVTYRRVTMNERNAFNWEACRWARRNQDRFPTDDRPLKRRQLNVEMDITTGGETA